MAAGFIVGATFGAATPGALGLAAGGTGLAAAGAARTALPIIPAARDKLGSLAGQFNMSASSIVESALKGQKFVDHANSGNINALIARPDGAAGFIRVTLDPEHQRIISAGLMRANDVARYIENGRFTAY